MTETDLVTAGGSTPEQAELPNTVNSEDSSPAAADAPSAAPAADPAPKADVTTDASTGSLSTMVLPELRALANSVGVKGASGMRKSELIAAIRESRGESVANTSDAPKAADKAEARPTRPPARPTAPRRQRSCARRQRGGRRDREWRGPRGRRAAEPAAP